MTDKEYKKKYISYNLNPLQMIDIIAKTMFFVITGFASLNYLFESGVGKGSITIFIVSIIMVIYFILSYFYRRVTTTSVTKRIYEKE